MLGEIGFLFLDVLLVTLFIEHILSRREKRSIMEKLNMVIGTFFSEVGLFLLKRFSVFVENSYELGPQLDIKPEWSGKDFKRAIKAAQNLSYAIKAEPEGLIQLREFFQEKRDFLLWLLENPNLLEHDRFTDLLWAIFHLSEELYFRGDTLEDLPQADKNHLAGV